MPPNSTNEGVPAVASNPPKELVTATVIGKDLQFRPKGGRYGPYIDASFGNPPEVSE